MNCWRLIKQQARGPQGFSAPVLLLETHQNRALVRRTRFQSDARVRRCRIEDLAAYNTSGNFQSFFVKPLFE